MARIESWVKAARLRTLPLSVSGIIVGSCIAASRGYFDAWILFLSLVTTIGFQILSNFANDYGDGLKGTDNEDRVGPQRAIQSGEISPAQMKKAMTITAVLTVIIALLLIHISFGKEYPFYAFLFILLGVSSIIAAIKYTVGDNAYGYSGLGDLFVFLFSYHLSPITFRRITLDDQNEFRQKQKIDLFMAAIVLHCGCLVMKFSMKLLVRAVLAYASATPSSVTVKK